MNGNNDQGVRLSAYESICLMEALRQEQARKNPTVNDTYYHSLESALNKLSSLKSGNGFVNGFVIRDSDSLVWSGDDDVS